MIVAGALIILVAVGALALSAAVATLLVRVLVRTDDHGGDPDWWPEFERGFAEYVSARKRPGGSAPSRPT
jgi:hypothetical protein